MTLPLIAILPWPPSLDFDAPGAADATDGAVIAARVTRPGGTTVALAPADPTAAIDDAEDEGQPEVQPPDVGQRYGI